MTSTAPGAHPPAEQVDALLDPAGGDARVDAHVAGCRHCQDVREGLEQVRALLGRHARELPPEPPDLGARIAAALAAEPPLGSPAELPDDAPAARPAGGATVTPLAQRRRRPATTWLAVAASVAVVGLGGTFLATRLAGGQDASESAGAAAPAPASAPFSPESAPQAGPESAPEAAPGSSAADPARGDAEPDASGGGPGGSSDPVSPSAPAPTRGALGATAEDLASGTDYTAAALARQAGALLVVPQSGVQRRPSGAQVERALADDAAVDSCLVAVGRPGADPVITDLATFEGEPAAVLVLAAPRGHDVVVVPDTCGSGDDRVLATVHLD